MSPLLSVIIPAYGVGEYLPACLDSVLASTYTELEVIVVDDGSPDESGEIADDFAARDSRIRVLHTSNQGLGPARNNGTAVAQGKYLAFADSDDLVPPRAYELMVSSLEHTGSDIAAGNTWRYIEGKGNVQSWTHAEAFAETRLRTHIRDYPVLIRDRMVWNKVFRRSFWDQGGFRFPAIRYEDYPVTLPAHLAARSVDVLSDKVYLWRQRILETSITQRSLELDNLQDRVTSAGLTLDVADAEGGEIRDRLHGYFTDVDTLTLAIALHEGRPEDRSDISGLALQLAQRLHPTQQWSQALPRQVLAALKRRDMEAAALLSQLRRGGSPAAVARAYLAPSRIRHLPALAVGIAFGGRAIPELKGRVLRSRVLNIARIDNAFIVTVETRLRRLLLERADVRAFVETDDSSILVPSTISALHGQRLTTEIQLTDELIGSIHEVAHRLIIEISVGPLQWRGDVNIARNQIPEPTEIAGDQLAVISRFEPGSVALWVRAVAASTLADVAFTKDTLEIHTNPCHHSVAMILPAPSAPLIAPVIDGVARFALTDVVSDPADDPVTSRAFRGIVALTEAAAVRLSHSNDEMASLVSEATGAGEAELAAGLPPEAETEHAVVDATVEQEQTGQQSVDATQRLEQTGITPLLLGTYPAKPVEAAGHRIQVAPSPSGTVEVIRQQLDHIPRY